MSLTNHSSNNRSTFDPILDAPRQPTFRERMRAHQAKEAAARQPAVAESLEARRLFAVTASLSSGILTITGTSGNDQILIGQSSNVITIYDIGTPLGTTYTNTQVSSKIVVNALNGDDTIRAHNDVDNLADLGGLSTTPVNEVFEIYSGAGVDVVGAGSLADIIVGGEDGDLCRGYGGNDSIFGDIAGPIGTSQGLQTGYDDQLFGGQGSDQIFGQFGGDQVDGDEGADELYGDFGSVTPGLGSTTDDDDTVNGGAGGDSIFGDASGSQNTGGPDELNGDGDDDTIYGETSGVCYGSNDTLTGSSGADDLYGGSGNDRIDGGLDADYLSGAYGDDTLIPGGGADSVFGDAGADSIEVTSDGVTDMLDGGADTDILSGSTGGIDNVSNIP